MTRVVSGVALLLFAVVVVWVHDSELTEESFAVVTLSIRGVLTALLTPVIWTPMSAQLLAAVQPIVTEGLAPGLAEDAIVPEPWLLRASRVCPLSGVWS